MKQGRAPKLKELRDKMQLIKYEMFTAEKLVQAAEGPPERQPSAAFSKNKSLSYKANKGRARSLSRKRKRTESADPGQE